MFRVACSTLRTASILRQSARNSGIVETHQPIRMLCQLPATVVSEPAVPEDLWNPIPCYSNQISNSLSTIALLSQGSKREKTAVNAKCPITTNSVDHEVIRCMTFKSHWIPTHAERVSCSVCSEPEAAINFLICDVISRRTGYGSP